MEGIFAKRSTKTVEYFHGAHMHRLPCVILAQFFQTSSARTRNTDSKFVYCCKRTCYKSGSPQVWFCSHTQTQKLPFSILSLSALKAFLEMNSAVLPAAEMTLGLYGLKRKTNQPTKGCIRNQVPVWLRTVDMPGTRSENKVNQQSLGGVINRMGNLERKWCLSL